jgi:hypothetical protein
MGLTEKRLAKQLQDEAIPKFQAEIQAIAGYTPTLDINWDTFTAYDEYPLTRLEGDIFPELLEVFQSICRDDMGKEALKSALTTIRLENTDDEQGSILTFEKNVLYLKMQLAGNVYRRHSAEQITKLLERSL